MGLTTKEKSLMQKVPEQWRGLLTPLLSYRSAKRDHLMSVLAMRYRRHSTHSAASWDMLLMAMSQNVPVVDDDGSLCFRSLLWCFPESFIQGFLMFLLRFHDTVSPDSLDRFLCTPVPEACASVVVPVFQQLSAVLAKHSAICLDDQAEGEQGERTRSPPADTSAEKSRTGDDDRSELTTKRSELLLDDGARGNNIYTDQTLPDVDIQSSAADKQERSGSHFVDSSVRGKKERCDRVEISTPQPTLSGKPAYYTCPDPAVNPRPLKGEENGPEKGLLPSTHTVDANASSFIIVLGSSDEEEEEGGGVEIVNVESVVRCKEVERANETEGAGRRDVGKHGDGNGQPMVERVGRGENSERQQNSDGGQAMMTMSELSSQQSENSDGGRAMMTTTMSELSSQRSDGRLPAEEEDVDQGDGTECLTLTHRLREALTTVDRDAAATDYEFLLAIPASQLSGSLAGVEWGGVEEDAVCGLIQGVVSVSGRMGHAAGAALITAILTPLYEAIEETPSRQLMSCLADLSVACPQHVASTLCDCLHRTPCNSAQSEMVTLLCKSWQSDMLLFFLRNLCSSDVQLDENLLAVAQCVVGKQPDLSSDLLESLLRLLETGSTPLARSARYGRLVLSFVKNYKSQLNSSHVPSLQSMVSVHSSVIRKSLQSAVHALPS